MLRKLVSISLLTLFLLYQVGYLGYYWYSASRINDEWLSREVVITPEMKHIAIPIALPYWTNQDEYQPTYGKILINGVVFRKVFQKYDQNKVHLILAQDRASQQLNQSIGDWMRLINEAGPEKSSGKSDLLKSLVKDYLSTQITFPAQSGSVIMESGFTSFYLFSKGDLFTRNCTPPPKV